MENFITILSSLISVIQKNDSEELSKGFCMFDKLRTFMEKAAKKNLRITDDIITSFQKLQKNKRENPNTCFVFWGYFSNLKQKPINLTEWLNTAKNEQGNLNFIKKLLSYKSVIINDPWEQIKFFDSKFPNHNKNLTCSLLKKYIEQGNPITEDVIQKAIEEESIEDADSTRLVYNAFELYLEKKDNLVTESILQKVVNTSNGNLVCKVFDKYYEQGNLITENVLQEAIKTGNKWVILKYVAGYLKSTLAQSLEYKAKGNDLLFSDLNLIENDPKTENVENALLRLKEYKNCTKLEIWFFKFIEKNELLYDQYLLMEVAFNILKQKEDEEIKGIIRKIAERKWKDFPEYAKNPEAKNAFDESVKQAIQEKKIYKIRQYLQKCDVDNHIARLNKKDSTNILNIIIERFESFKWDYSQDYRKQNVDALIGELEKIIKETERSQWCIPSKIAETIRYLRDGNNENGTSAKGKKNVYSELEILFLKLTVKYDLFTHDDWDIILDVAFKMLNQEDDEDIKSAIRKVV